MLAGKKALVTGASKGVGAAIAERLAREGALVCLVARSEDSLRETARRCKDSGATGAAVFPCDLGNPQEVDRLGAALLEAHGCIHVLVNCAGAYPNPGQAPEEGDPDAWEAALRLNVLAPLRLTRLLAPAMVKEGGGHIVNVGSVAGCKGVADEASYSATKWAIRGWSNSCYEALREHGVKVTLIQPAHVATDMAAVQGGTRYSEMRPELMIQPEDVAQAVVLPFHLSSSADPVEIILNRLQTPYAA